jgi:hypothetical protein
MLCWFPAYLIATKSMSITFFFSPLLFRQVIGYKVSGEVPQFMLLAHATEVMEQSGMISFVLYGSAQLMYGTFPNTLRSPPVANSIRSCGGRLHVTQDVLAPHTQRIDKRIASVFRTEGSLSQSSNELLLQLPTVMAG